MRRPDSGPAIVCPCAVALAGCFCLGGDTVPDGGGAAPSELRNRTRLVNGTFRDTWVVWLRRRTVPSPSFVVSMEGQA